MNLHDMMARDVRRVFMNKQDFAVTHKMRYCGEIYDITCVITDGDASDSKATANGHTTARKQTNDDNVSGLFQVSKVMHAASDAFFLPDVPGEIYPERGKQLFIYDKDADFWDEYYIVSCERQTGIIRVSLGAFDE